MLVKKWDAVTLILSLLRFCFDGIRKMYEHISIKQLLTQKTRLNQENIVRSAIFVWLFTWNSCTLLWEVVSPSFLHKSFQIYDISLPDYTDLQRITFRVISHINLWLVCNCCQMNLIFPSRLAEITLRCLYKLML